MEGLLLGSIQMLPAELKSLGRDGEKVQTFVSNGRQSCRIVIIIGSSKSLSAAQLISKPENNGKIANFLATEQTFG